MSKKPITTKHELHYLVKNLGDLLDIEVYEEDKHADKLGDYLVLNCVEDGSKKKIKYSLFLKRKGLCRIEYLFEGDDMRNIYMKSNEMYIKLEALIVGIKLGKECVKKLIK